MRQIRIEKITFNVGTGTDQKLLVKGMKLLKNITGIEPVKNITKKRIPSFGVRPGLPIGCKVTIRGEKATELLKRLIAAKENNLKKSCFDNNGNVSFGIHEYIDVPDLEYDSDIGIMGFQIAVTLMRPGFRVKNRRRFTRKIGKKHKIIKDDAMKFFTEKLSVNIVEGDMLDQF